MFNAEELIRGKSDFINCEYDNMGDSLAAKYAILKYPKYAPTLDFEHITCISRCVTLHISAIFSLLVNGYDELAKDRIIKCEKIIGNPFIDLDFFTYCRVDYFKAASRDMCEWLMNRYPNCPGWCYLVTAWCIMEGYDIQNLKFAKDHFKLAERLGKQIDDNEKISIFIDFKYSFYASFEDVGNLCIDGDKCFFSEPTLDMVCLMETYQWNNDMPMDYKDLQ